VTRFCSGMVRFFPGRLREEHEVGGVGRAG
jgi:hypothetical protein